MSEEQSLYGNIDISRSNVRGPPAAHLNPVIAQNPQGEEQEIYENVNYGGGGNVHSADTGESLPHPGDSHTSNNVGTIAEQFASAWKNELSRRQKAPLNKSSSPHPATAPKPNVLPKPAVKLKPRLVTKDDTPDSKPKPALKPKRISETPSHNKSDVVNRNSSIKSTPSTDQQSPVRDLPSPTEENIKKDDSNQCGILEKVVNLYGPEPSGEPNQKFTGATLDMEMFRRNSAPEQSRTSRQVVKCCSAIWGILLVLSLVGNILLCWMYLSIRQNQQITTGVEVFSDTWEKGYFGETINSAMLVNVASVYSGASCDGSEHYCQYAMDDRDTTQVSWPPRQYLRITLDANYTIMATEIRINTSQATPSEIMFVFGNQENTQKYKLRRYRAETSQNGTTRFVIVLNTTSASSVFIQFDGTQPVGLYEIRLYGFGDPPVPVDCCPPGFLHSPDLHRCYYISAALVNKTKNYDGAKTKCSKKDANLLSINSLAEHDFLRPYLHERYGQTSLPGFKKTNESYVVLPHFWTSLEKFDDKWFWSGLYPSRYTAWEPNQPDWTPENCMELRVKADFRWNDKTCTTNENNAKHLFVCEKESTC